MFSNCRGMRWSRAALQAEQAVPPGAFVLCRWVLGASSVSGPSDTRAAERLRAATADSMASRSEGAFIGGSAMGHGVAAPCLWKDAGYGGELRSGSEPGHPRNERRQVRPPGIRTFPVVRPASGICRPQPGVAFVPILREQEGSQCVRLDPSQDLRVRGESEGPSYCTRCMYPGPGSVPK